MSLNNWVEDNTNNFGDLVDVDDDLFLSQDFERLEVDGVDRCYFWDFKIPYANGYISNLWIGLDLDDFNTDFSHELSQAYLKVIDKSSGCLLDNKACTDLVFSSILNKEIEFYQDQLLIPVSSINLLYGEMFPIFEFTNGINIVLENFKKNAVKGSIYYTLTRLRPKNKSHSGSSISIKRTYFYQTDGSFFFRCQMPLLIVIEFSKFLDTRNNAEDVTFESLDIISKWFKGTFSSHLGDIISLEVLGKSYYIVSFDTRLRAKSGIKRFLRRTKAFNFSRDTSSCDDNLYLKFKLNSHTTYDISLTTISLNDA